MNTIINSIRIYRGTGIPGMTGSRVVVLAVLRGDETLKDDAQVGDFVRGEPSEAWGVFLRVRPRESMWAR